MDRRTFLSWISGLMGTCAAALAGLPVVSFFLAPLGRKRSGGTVDLAPLSRIPADRFGSFVATHVAEEGYARASRTLTVWAKREGETVIAFSAVCTHLSCNVAWDGAKFLCPCHGGTFGPDGGATHGPPTKPLHKFETCVQDGTVKILLPENFAG